MVAIFLAPKPRVAMRSMAKRSSVDRTMLREGLKTLVICGKCGLWCMDMSSGQSCASVCDIENVLICDFFHQRKLLIKRGLKFVVFHPNFELSLHLVGQIVGK